MPAEVISHLIHNLKYTWFFALFFVLWPFVVAFGGVLLAAPQDGAKVGLGEALYRSCATYSGLDRPALNPATGQQRWVGLCHRVLGALAWAYAAAIFIASIG